MASIQKYTHGEVVYMLRHNARECPRAASNADIDPARTPNNYTLLPDRAAASSCRDYYRQRLGEIYHMQRKDIVTACQWVITVPTDLAAEQERDFFECTMDYLNNLYGEQNCIQAVVHRDEGVKDRDGNIIAGRAHLHYLFLPVVANDKYMQPNKHGNITAKAQYTHKLCANDLINRRHLQQWHTDYQQWINDAGITATVQSGVTGGRNKTVEMLKSETKMRSLERENKQLKEKIATLEKEKTRDLDYNLEW
nr:unnamed protein product [uncultured bacterium]